MNFFLLQIKFYLIWQVLYIESVYILMCCLQSKSSSNWWKFEDIWGKFTKHMLFFVQKKVKFVAKLNHRAFDGQVC